MTEFTTDPAFREFLRPLSDSEFSKLEADILKNGIRDPVVLWNGVLIDGHNRTTIAKMHGLPFKTVEMQFESKLEAIQWIAMNQIGRRNLTTVDRVLLALALKPIYAELGKAKRDDTGRVNVQGTSFAQLSKTDGSTVVGDPAKAFEKIDTRQMLADVAGVSKATFGRFEVVIANRPPEVLQAIRDGETTVSAEYKKLDRISKDMDAKIKAFELVERVEKLDLGVKIVDSLYSQSGLKTRAVVNMYDPALKDLGRRIFQDSIYYVVVSTLKDTYKVPDLVPAGMNFAGIVVLEIGGTDIKLAHVFGPSVELPAVVKFATLGEALAASMSDFVKAGDVVANPYPKDGKIADAFIQLKTVGTVFNSTNPERLAVIVDQIGTQE